MARLVSSFRHAWHGIVYVVSHEANARIHLVVATIALIAGVLLGLSHVAMAAVLFAVILVFLAEIINTAFEKTLDLVVPGHHPQVKLVKDMAAGAVLITSLFALLIGIVIFTPYVVDLWVK